MNGLKHGQFAIISARALDDIRFDDKDKYLRALLILGTYADKNGQCFPSLNTVGEHLNISKSTMSLIFHDLQEWGYIAITKRINPNTGAQTSNGYRIVYDTELPIQFVRVIPEPPIQEPLIASESPIRVALKENGTNGPHERPILTGARSEIFDSVPSVPREHITAEKAIEITKQNMAEHSTQVHSAGISSPYAEQEAYIAEASSLFSTVLEHDKPTPSDKAAAQKCFQAKIPIDKLKEFCRLRQDKYKPSNGNEPDAHWIWKDVLNWRARGYKVDEKQGTFEGMKLG